MKSKIRTKRTTKFIAVIMRDNSDISMRPDGAWSAFVANTKTVAVTAALDAKKNYEKNSGFGPYVCLVGELAEIASPLTNFTIKPIA